MLVSPLVLFSCMDLISSSSAIEQLRSKLIFKADGMLVIYL